MNTLHTLPLKYYKPSSQIEISTSAMEWHPTTELQTTLYRAIGRIGYWLVTNKYGDISPQLVEDDEVREGKLMVGLTKTHAGQRITLFTAGENGSRFDTLRGDEFPRATNEDAIIEATLTEMPRISPANGWYFRPSDLATAADIVVGHNFLAQAVGTPQIPIAPGTRTKALAHLCLTDDIPKEKMPFRSGL